MARVSCLIPCRDAAAYVDAAVGSIVEQTYRDLEIVLVDDASSDDSPVRLARWAARDPRVRLVPGPGRGIVAALHAGLAAASGELVARMDADDIAHPDRLRRQVALLDAGPDIAACGTGVRYFPPAAVRDGARRYERWLNGLTSPADLARDMFIECPIAHPTLLVRRGALDAAGGWRDAGWPEDYDLVLRVWAAGGKLANVGDVLLAWRERPDRLSRTHAHYTLDAFHRCKAHYLARTLLRGREVVIVGGGPVGKGFARALAAEGAIVAAFVDLDPRRIGQTVHGAPVVAREDVGLFGAAFAVAAVAGPVARGEIRAWLEAQGRRELDDFCAVA